MSPCTCCTPEATLTRESEAPSRPADEQRDPSPGCGCGESCGCGTGDQASADVHGGVQDHQAERQLQT